MHILVPFCYLYAIYRPCSYSLGSLLRIPAPSCSFHSMYRPCSYTLGSLVHILVPFCSLYAFHRSCSYSLESLVHIIALLCSFLHSNDLALTIYSHLCASLLHSALLRNLQTFFILWRVISSHPSFILLFLCIPQTLLLLFKVIIAHPSFITLLLCNLQTLLLFIRVITVHSSSTLLFFFAFHRPCSYSLWSLLPITAPFCYFYAI